MSAPDDARLYEAELIRALAYALPAAAETPEDGRDLAQAARIQREGWRAGAQRAIQFLGACLRDRPERAALRLALADLLLDRPDAAQAQAVLDAAPGATDNGAAGTGVELRRAAAAAMLDTREAALAILQRIADMLPSVPDVRNTLLDAVSLLSLPPQTAAASIASPRGQCLNLGSGKLLHRSTEQQRWINTDIAPLPGVQVVDAFRYPWLWDNDSFDRITASHLAEHIPHQPAVEQQAGDALFDALQASGYVRRLAELDGFFAFFAEAWRVLKPGGEIDIVCPYGLSFGAIQDPTHTRSIVPATVDYLAWTENGNFDYGLPFRYESVSLGFGGLSPRYQSLLAEPDASQRIMAAASTEWNVIQTLAFSLRKVPL